jgi:5S rRNA maturation endonuclease (ribonuclease M5)
LLFQKVRFKVPPPKLKTFGLRQRDGRGGWINNINGVRRVLYRLPEVRAAQQVIVVEGEKDTDNVAAEGFACTTNFDGAGKWLAEYSEVLRGKDVIVMADNDKDGDIHRPLVASQLLGIAKSVRIAKVPKQFKDISDYLVSLPESDRRGAIQRLIDEAKEFDPSLPQIQSYQISGQSIIHYSREEIDETQNLLGDRWLERGHGALLTGPSGIGKSTGVYQAQACWACGLIPFSIKPPRPLRIVTVQTEDSHNDLIEMSRCVDRLGLSEREVELVQRNAHIETINDAIGQEFIRKLDSFLFQNPRDLIILNPLSDFIPGELVDEAEVKYFLRGLLNPLLKRHHCGVLCVQPTPKTNRDNTDKYSWWDWMYWGAGSAEFARWARGGIVIVPTVDRAVYRFIAAKRFEKLGWQYHQYFYAHSVENDALLWIPASQEQVAACQKQAAAKPEDLHSVFPAGKDLTREQVRLLAKERLKLGKHAADDFVKILVNADWIQPREYPRERARPEIRFFKNENPDKSLR